MSEIIENQELTQQAQKKTKDDSVYFLLPNALKTEIIPLSDLVHGDTFHTPESFSKATGQKLIPVVNNHFLMRYSASRREQKLAADLLEFKTLVDFTDTEGFQIEDLDISTIPLNGFAILNKRETQVVSRKISLLNQGLEDEI